MARDIIIDPTFGKPPHVVDLRDGNSLDGREFYNNQSPISTEDETQFSDIPRPPSEFTIVSQIVRTGSDGKQVVDIILELPDNLNAKEYDIRVAKT